MPSIPPLPINAPPLPPSSNEVTPPPLPNLSQDTAIPQEQTYEAGTFSPAQIYHQKTRYPYSFPDSAYTPPASPNSSQHSIFTYKQTTNNNSHSNITSGAVVLTYPCPHERAACPRAPYEDDNLALLAHYLLRTEGRLRFPRRSHHSFVHTDLYSLPYRAVDPVPFTNAEFAIYWAATPLTMEVPIPCMEEEGLYRGAIYRLSTSPYSSEEVMSRGTSIILNGKDAAYVRYFITIRRHMNPDCSLIQLNAVTHDNMFVAYDHPDWPTIYLCIPNRFCKVPIHEDLLPYYIHLIKRPSSPLLSLLSSWWNTFKNIGRNTPLLIEEKKWEVESIR